MSKLTHRLAGVAAPLAVLAALTLASGCDQGPKKDDKKASTPAGDSKDDHAGHDHKEGEHHEGEHDKAVDAPKLPTGDGGPTELGEPPDPLEAKDNDIDSKVKTESALPE